MDLHPDGVRRRALADAPSAPWVTYYGPGPGERVELSRVTLDNWVAKAGGLLAEDFDVDGDAVIAIDLDCHWLLHVWTWAVWALGATVTTPAAADAATLVVANPESPLVKVTQVPVLAVGNHPWGTALTGATPRGCHDVMAEVLTYPDVLVVPPPDASARALITDDHTDATGAECVAAARLLRPPGARRMLVAYPSRTGTNPPGAGWLLAATLSAATGDGSTVLVHPEVTESAVAKISLEEQVDTAVAEPLHV